MLTSTHSRDADIEFDEPLHKYTVKGSTDFTSVTTFIGGLFPIFDPDAVIAKMVKGKNWKSSKYFGMEPEAIKKQWADAGAEASSEGTKMHEAIELHYKEGKPGPSTPEFGQFLDFAAQCKWKPLRSEWRVYHENIKIVGTIDMVFELPDGRVAIYDWKRTKQLDKNENWGKRSTHPKLAHIPDTNYWHYALQLNLYQFVLEAKYGLVVAERMLVCCHPTRESYELAGVPDLQAEIRSVFSL